MGKLWSSSGGIRWCVCAARQGDGGWARPWRGESLSLSLSTCASVRVWERARPRFIAAYKFFSLLTVQMCPEQSSRHTHTHTIKCLFAPAATRERPQKRRRQAGAGLRTRWPYLAGWADDRRRSFSNLYSPPLHHFPARPPHTHTHTHKTVNPRLCFHARGRQPVSPGLARAVKIFYLPQERETHAR